MKLQIKHFKSLFGPQAGCWMLAAICWLGISQAPGIAAGATVALESVLIADVPHVQQKPDFCGEACAEMYLRKLGSSLTQDDVFNVAGVDPLPGRGCNTREMAAALTAVGFKVGSVWCQVSATNAQAEIEAQFAVLHADLARGIPSIVCMRTGAGPEATEHMRLILGYDAKTNAVIYHEPSAADDGAYRQMPRRQFLDCWPLKYSPTRWTLIRLRLEPGSIRRKAEPKRGFTDADYARHMQELKKKIPGKEFSVVIERPFVVIGDEAPGVVKIYAQQTVAWAVKRLKAAYFEKDPANIIDIWLFKDKESYEKHTREIFNDTPTTPFGYSSTEHNALIMNIGTGGGTLVHEMVHPFMAADFPACPSWFNEGLASLYEQSSDQDDKIVGLTNWRLAGLQQSIKDKQIPSFDKLTHTTSAEFYNDDSGTHYAQARYLCYYLQENGLLQKYYRQFKANSAQDPSGYDTLKAVLGRKDMAAFQKKWEQFVLGLRFP
jgi:hypothetical protein